MAHLTTITTCTHDMMGTLPETIASVLGQTAPELEYLILDDGSSDGTWEYLQRFRDEARVRLFRFPTRRGLTACRNFLLGEARGEFLSIADADDILAPEKTERHARILAADERAGVAWGRALVVSDADPQSRFRLVPGLEERPGWDLAGDYRVVHSATTWRTRLLRELGGYDPRRTAVEAVDLFLRVGDAHRQVFSGTVDALKRIDPENAFRTALSGSERRVSAELLLAALERRHRLSSGPLWERLRAAIEVSIFPRS